MRQQVYPERGRLRKISSLSQVNRTTRDCKNAGAFLSRLLFRLNASSLSLSLILHESSTLFDEALLNSIVNEQLSSCFFSCCTTVLNLSLTAGLFFLFCPVLCCVAVLCVCHSSYSSSELPFFRIEELPYSVVPSSFHDNAVIRD